MAALSQITLTQLECVKTSETGKDEVFFTVGIDNLVSGQYPTDGTYHSMSPDDDNPWPLNVTYAYTQAFNIYFWDNDGPSDNDPLGNYTFSAGQTYSSPVTISNPNGAEYQLSFKIDTCD